nr:hypothetical protein [Mycobacterium sp. UM_NZ2]
MGLELALATVGVVHGIVSTATIQDRRVVANSCDSSQLPEVECKQVMPLTTEQVAAAGRSATVAT